MIQRGIGESLSFGDPGKSLGIFNERGYRPWTLISSSPCC